MIELENTAYLDREIHEHCSQFVEQVRLLAPLDRVAVILFDQEVNSSRVAFAWRTEEAILPNPKSLATPAPYAEKMVLNLPLYGGEGRIGTALLHHQDGIRLGRQETQLVYRMSEELSTRLENAELTRQLQASERERAALEEIAQIAEEQKARGLVVANGDEGSGQLNSRQAGLAHTLRGPLTSIKGYASSLLRTDVNWSEELEREFLETIDREADRLNQAVSDLLDTTLDRDLPG